MERNFLSRAAEYINEERRKRRWTKVVTAMAAVVVFCTTYALILPAITLETDVFCGQKEHSHDESCYEQSLICTQEEAKAHAHGADCYETHRTLVCTQAESAGHSHSEACMTESSTLTCASEEEGHEHGEGCYTVTSSVTCGQAEEAGHTHGDSCWQETKTLVCTESTEIPEGGHVHGPECYGGEELACEKEEHEHELMCYSNPKADLETRSDWERTLPDELTYIWADDLLAVAESQLGYRESTENYQVDEDDRKLGYTRYGDWYGDNYGHWCAMFVSFCLHYAEIPTQDFPWEANCQRWIDELSEEKWDLYRPYDPESDENYVPVPGDLIFFNTDDDPESDHVGIVKEVEPATESREAQVVTIEGNSSNRVEENTYDLTDDAIMGYAQLPEAEYLCGLEIHDHSSDCYDAESTLTCEVPEHAHEKGCITGDFALEEPEEPEEEPSQEDPAPEETPSEEEPEEEPAEETFTCGLTAHSHMEDCYLADGTLTCQIEEHTHDESCAVQEEAPEEVPPVEEEQPDYICGFEEHIHNISCVPVENQAFMMLSEPSAEEYICGMVEHIHNEECLTEVQESELTEELQRSAWAISLIEALPSAEDVESQLLTYEDADDWDGYEAYLLEVAETVKNAYALYQDLNDEERAGVTNYQKLQDLEWTWAMQTMTLRKASSYQVFQFNSHGTEESTGLAKTSLFYGKSPYEHGVTSWGFYYWSAILIEPDANGRLYVADMITAKGTKNTTSPQTSNGLVLMLWHDEFPPSTFGISVGDTVVIEGFDYQTNAQTLYNGTSLGTVSFYTGIDYRAPSVVTETSTTKPVSTSEFVDLNLYDYNGSINSNYNKDHDWPGFQWNGGAYHKSGASYNRRAIDFIDFGNSLITNFSYTGSNNGKATTAIDIGNKGGNINAIVEYPDDDWANKPVGISNGTAVLSRTLGADGYPQVLNAGSMAGYFSNSAFATKQNTSSIDGLFQQNKETGEYFYNSRENHAQYSGNRFTLYNEMITPNFITYPFGNFLPLNTITNADTATHVGSISYGKLKTYIGGEIIASLNNSTDATKVQLRTMLGKYREDLLDETVGDSTAWDTWSAKDAIYDYILHGPTDDSGPITDALLNKMYNIDYDVATNFFFGMDMTMNFMQPKGGMTGNDTNKDGESDYPMVFYFTGDDDVWVYIDDVLFLDLSGIHRHVGGEIDFVKGEVRYYALSPATGDVASSPYLTQTFNQILSAAGKSTDGLNSKGTFVDYTNHQFKFYYMERGSGSSVCRLNFNFPLLRQNSISVSKEVSVDEAYKPLLGDPDYKFQVLKANANGGKTNELFIGANTSYNIYDANNTKIGTGTTDANGVFTLKAGQRAEFTGIKENAGKYFVRELLEQIQIPQYGEITVSGQSTTTSGEVTVGTETFKGADSPVKDMSDGATAFRFDNSVKGDALGSLEITKQLEELPAVRAVKQFNIKVTLDGNDLPVGTPYRVGEETRRVMEAGIITIAAGETAVLPNIYLGTKFVVTETSESASGYNVTYQVGNGNPGATAAGRITEEAENVQVIVINKESGDACDIGFTKTLTNPDGVEPSTREFQFSLVEVADATGAAPVPNGVNTTTSVTVQEQTIHGGFTLGFKSLDNPEGTHYYKLTEVIDPANPSIIYDDTVYIVKVEVSNASGVLSAEITDVIKDGKSLGSTGSIDFENYVATYELPETGGAGTNGYTFGGLLLMLGAGFLLYRKTRDGREAKTSS